MLRPNKHKGQHWLISKKYLEKIIESAQIKKDETVLEIGPGTGNLTEELLKSGAQVIAVEKDHDLIKLLLAKTKSVHEFAIADSRIKLKIIEDDILEFDENQIKTNYKIVANIPYYITGPIIQKFLWSANPPAEMILMVQKEVGERICAQPPRANYLSSMVQSLAETKILFKVSRDNFWPKPKVDSVVIKITPQRQATSDPTTLKLRGAGKGQVNEFTNFLKIVFRQPRQTLFNNLKRGKLPQEKIDAVFIKLKISKNTRPQNLSVNDLRKLFVSFVCHL